ncbi:MAG: methyltransferase domain-containing protein [Christensenellaceae bacterium]|jgi:SAM-dependent methyltransferase|nr:methyltransferase domain-containing protein [Christensenellaceae bacterium]
MLEKMDEFFIARLDGYDEHMLRDVEGVAEGYVELARQLPEGARTLLDLGCGTGLELGELFKRCPELAVTGIDLTRAMLDKLGEKYAGKPLELICGSYLGRDFGEMAFDAAVSFETLHHLPHNEKRALYKRLFRAIKPGGRYIEGDYIVDTQAEEDRWFAESARLRAEQGIPDGEFVHFDTPCTVENQILLLREAGFLGVSQVWRSGNTVVLAAEKGEADAGRP